MRFVLQRRFRKRLWVLSVLAAMLLVIACHTPPSTSQSLAATRRNPLTWPFSVDSIWNMPIGTNAVYKPANIERAGHATADVDYFFVLKEGDPLQPLYAIGNWGPGRSSGTFYQNIALPLPDNLIIPDATPNATPNNSAAFLMPDGRTLVQMNVLTRDRPGSFVYGWRAPDQDIYGKGILGGHAGSGLSSIGGTVRQGELLGTTPIRHALKINLQASRYFSFDVGPGGGRGYRWPAVNADSYATATTYAGKTPGLMLGTLLAIPPSVTARSLGLETPAGAKLFAAFQNYGAYVADDTAWDAHAIAVENGVLEEFRQAYGYAFEGHEGAFHRDYMKLFSALQIVDNNSPQTIGGGGSPRVPLAPPFARETGHLKVGTPGDDVLVGTANSDSYSGKGGNDTLTGMNQSDFLSGEEDSDLLAGGNGSDFLMGGTGSDRLQGDEGQDYLDGGAENDTLSGGAGNDTLSGWSGDDLLDGGEGIDTLVESPENYGLRDVEFVLTNTTLTGNGSDRLTSIERVILTGDDGNNAMNAAQFTAGTVHLDGGKGNDRLWGGAGGDRLIGGEGDDWLNAAGENRGKGAIDFLRGGAGRDRFVLGDARGAYYADSTTTRENQNGYAVIEDFEPTQDVIQLSSPLSQYGFVQSPFSNQMGTAIVLRSGGRDELIAIILNATRIPASALVE
jgi:Ca2+-binding RTX toxin-like protein